MKNENRFIRKKQEKRKRTENEEEDVEKFIKNLKISKEDGWMTPEEETDIFIQNYIQEIRLECEKMQRCEKWVNDHFFEHLIF